MPKPRIAIPIARSQRATAIVIAIAMTWLITSGPNSSTADDDKALKNNTKSPQRPCELATRVQTLETSLLASQVKLDGLLARIDALERRENQHPPQHVAPPPTKSDKPKASPSKPYIQCKGTAYSTGKRCRCRIIEGSEYCEWHQDQGEPARP
jgi:hypothetical protein